MSFSKFVATIIVISIIIFAATIAISLNLPQKPLQLEGTGLVELSRLKGSTVIALLDDSAVLLRNETFMRYYFDSGKVDRLGRVQLGKSDVRWRRMNCRWVDGVLVVYPPLRLGVEGDHPLSVIDFETNKMRRFASHPTSNMWNNFLTPYKGNVLALGGAQDINNHIMRYDIHTGDSEIVLEASTDAMGSEFHAIDSYGNKVYVVSTLRPSPGAGKATVIKVYDNDFNYLEEIALNAFAHVAEAMAHHIIDFRVFGQYVYWRSDSAGSSLIAEIKNGGELSVLNEGGVIIGTDAVVHHNFGGNPFNLAFNSDLTTNMQVFYEQRSSSVVLFNTNDGTFHEIDLPIADVGYETMYMVANGNTVLICAVPIGISLFGNERYFLYEIPLL